MKKEVKKLLSLQRMKQLIKESLGQSQRTAINEAFVGDRDFVSSDDDDLNSIEVGDVVDVDVEEVGILNVRVTELIDDVGEVSDPHDPQEFSGPGFSGEIQPGQGESGSMVFSLKQVIPGSKAKGYFPKLGDEDDEDVWGRPSVNPYRNMAKTPNVKMEASRFYSSLPHEDDGGPWGYDPTDTGEGDDVPDVHRDECPVCGRDHSTEDVDCDYEECGYCGFDHEYAPEGARRWHEENDPDGKLYENASSPAEAMVMKLVPRFGVKRRVKLKDLRSALVDLSRDQQDSALKSLQKQGKLVLMRQDNPMEIDDEDEDAALLIAGNPRHLIYFEGKSKKKITENLEGALDPRMVDALDAFTQTFVTCNKWHAGLDVSRAEWSAAVDEAATMLKSQVESLVRDVAESLMMGDFNDDLGAAGWPDPEET